MIEEWKYMLLVGTNILTLVFVLGLCDRLSTVSRQLEAVLKAVRPDLFRDD